MRLPGEHELVNQLGVSRTTLREALGALTHLGLLEARAGDGTYVRASSEFEAVLMRRAAESRHQELREIRAVLEEYASSCAALRRSPDDLHEMRTLLAEVGDAVEVGSMKAAVEADSRFHKAIVRAGNNALLTEIYEVLGEAVSTYLDSVPFDTEALVEHERLHHSLVAAIESGDETAARYAASAIVALNPIEFERD